MEDVRPRVRRGAAGERERERVAQQVSPPAQLAIHRAEFVAPLGDAVGFVHREQRGTDSGSPQGTDKRAQALRSTVEETHLAGERRLQHGASCLPGEGAVQVRRRNATPPQRADLILH